MSKVATATKTLAEKPSVFEAYNRSKKGPKVDEKTWDFQIIPQTAKKLKEKYGIAVSKKQMVPTKKDKDMLKRLYEAGLEMLVECGIYNIDTGRVIKWTKDEVLMGVAYAPRMCIIGEGPLHARVMTQRIANDPRPPIVQGGPTGAPCSEQWFSGIHESYAKEGIVDMIVDGVLETIDGYNPAPESPWEVKAAKKEAMLIRLAQANCSVPGQGL